MVLDAGGAHVHTLTASQLVAEDGFATQAVSETLTTHKAPQADARQVLAQGLERAKNTERNAFIYLSAPW